ncbi:MAG: hypothetical protein P4M11_03530 [Candidatus Pacebacteria bacterium]|nr:hypothetical protein [Candidatus Paceibacterota bacterium]
MLDDFVVRSKDCYVASIEERFFADCARAIHFDRPLPRRRFLCNDAKEFFGSAATPLMRLLVTLRENNEVFGIFVKAIDADKTLGEDLLNDLASDIVHFLFADFTSVNRNVNIILYHFKYLLRVSSITCLSPFRRTCCWSTRRLEPEPSWRRTRS